MSKKGNNNVAGVLAGLLAGAAAGVILGMLYAPEEGTETRKKIKTKAKDLKHQAEGKYSEVSENEQTKVTIRNARQEGMKELRRLEGVSEDLIKNVEADIQTLTDQYSKKSEDSLKHKEEDILKV